MSRMTLLLLLTTACPSFEKDLLDTGDTAGDETAGTASTTTVPTTSGAPTPTTTDATTTDATSSDGPQSAAPMALFSFHILACMPYCARDLEPSTEFVQPDCQLYELDEFGEPEVEMTACIDAGDRWNIPDGSTRCYATLVDRGDPLSEAYDQMNPECVAAGSNVEFMFVLSEKPPPGLLVGGVCEQSQQPAIDCPDL